LRLGGSGAHEIDWSQADFSGFRKLAGWMESLDPTLLVLLAAAVIGFAVRWRASARAVVARKDVAIALGFVLPYLAFVGPLNEVFERFLLPLLPWIATAGASFLVWIAGTKRPWLLPVLGTIAVLFPALVLAQFARVSARPDSGELVARWFASEPERMAAPVVASAGFVMPLPFELDALRADLRDPAGRATVWTQFQGSLPDASIPRPRIPLYMLPAALAQRPDRGLEAWFDELRPAYVVLERSRKNLFLDGGRALTEIVRARGELVYAIGDVAPAIEEYGVLHYQTMNAYVPRLLATERFGPALEVWRIRR
jgi:hypothetical protein